MSPRLRALLLFLFVALMAIVSPADAQVLPKITVGVEQANSPQEASITLQLVFLIDRKSVV